MRDSSATCSRRDGVLREPPPAPIGFAIPRPLDGLLIALGEALARRADLQQRLAHRAHLLGDALAGIASGGGKVAHLVRTTTAKPCARGARVRGLDRCVEGQHVRLEGDGFHVARHLAQLVRVTDQRADLFRELIAALLDGFQRIDDQPEVALVVARGLLGADARCPAAITRSSMLDRGGWWFRRSVP